MQHRKAPSYMRVLTRARPLLLQWPAPLRVISLARTHLRWSQLHGPPPMWCTGSRSCIFPVASPGSAFPPPLAPGLGFGICRGIHKYVFIVEITRGNALTHACLSLGPPLDLATFFLVAHALATRALCLFFLTLTVLRSLYYLSTKV